MNESSLDFSAQLRRVIVQAEKKADAYRRYLVDEEAYAFAARLSFAEGELSFPPVEESLPLDFEREEQAFFALRSYHHLVARERALCASAFLLREERSLAGEHIVYVRNYYTERAYEIFAGALANPTVSYASDFTDACASVGEGLADLCILPLRDEGWVPFHTFARMPENYGLRVCALCTVARANGDTLHMALCARGCRVPTGAKNIAVELLLSTHEARDIEALRGFAEMLSGKIVFAEALPDRYTHKSAWRVTYVFESASLAPFLFGRRLLAPDAELLGIYEMPDLSNDGE